jgi:lipoprotein-releasing system ATP-binding protein
MGHMNAVWIWLRQHGGQLLMGLLALLLGAALLLADEPTGNLDTKSADAVFALLRRINQEQGTTVLLVTHNPELGKRCDKTIQVVDGLIQT